MAAVNKQQTTHRKLN